MKRLLIATVAIVTLFSGISISNAAHADDRRGRDRDLHDNNRHDDHDWGKRKHWNNKDYRPKRVFYYTPRYYTPRTQVVYYAPQPSYYGTYYSQNFASPTEYTETYYPDGGYTRTYTVGGYLPQNRHWAPMPDYVRYGLPSPGRGQRWVRSDRDAVLISEATSRIISGIILAASID